MILRVTIENLYSFMEETEISFVAGKSTLHSEQVSRAEKLDITPTDRWPQTVGTRVYLLAKSILGRKNNI